jgi:hypothetical protein
MHEESIEKRNHYYAMGYSDGIKDRYNKAMEVIIKKAAFETKPIKFVLQKVPDFIMKGCEKCTKKTKKS